MALSQLPSILLWGKEAGGGAGGSPHSLFTLPPCSTARPQCTHPSAGRLAVIDSPLGIRQILPSGQSEVEGGRATCQRTPSALLGPALGSHQTVMVCGPRGVILCVREPRHGG